MSPHWRAVLSVATSLLAATSACAEMSSENLRATDARTETIELAFAFFSRSVSIRPDPTCLAAGGSIRRATYPSRANDFDPTLEALALNCSSLGLGKELEDEHGEIIAVKLIESDPDSWQLRRDPDVATARQGPGANHAAAPTGDSGPSRELGLNPETLDQLMMVGLSTGFDRAITPNFASDTVLLPPERPFDTVVPPVDSLPAAEDAPDAADAPAAESQVAPTEVLPPAASSDVAPVTVERDSALGAVHTETPPVASPDVAPTAAERDGAPVAIHTEVPQAASSGVASVDTERDAVPVTVHTETPLSVSPDAAPVVVERDSAPDAARPPAPPYAAGAPKPQREASSRPKAPQPPVQKLARKPARAVSLLKHRVVPAPSIPRPSFNQAPNATSRSDVSGIFGSFGVGRTQIRSFSPKMSAAGPAQTQIRTQPSNSE